MRTHFARAFLLLALLGLSVSAACVVRTQPQRGRHHVVHDHRDGHHDRGKHKKHKKPKKHRKHR